MAAFADPPSEDRSAETARPVLAGFRPGVTATRSSDVSCPANPEITGLGLALPTPEGGTGLVGAMTLNEYHGQRNVSVAPREPVPVSEPEALLTTQFIEAMFTVVELIAVTFGKSSTVPLRNVSSEGLAWLLARLALLIAT